MARPALLDALARIAEPVVKSKGLEIWGLEVLQAGRPLARIYVDVPGCVRHEATGMTAAEGDDAVSATVSEGPASASIDQCAEISRMVGLALEVEDIFASAYVLEVSSPGLSRPFFRADQLPPYVGDNLEVTLNEGHPDFIGRKKFRGQLASVTGEHFVLTLEDGGTLETEWSEVRKAARAHVFAMPEKPGKKRKDEK